MTRSRRSGLARPTRSVASCSCTFEIVFFIFAEASLITTPGSGSSSASRMAAARRGNAKRACRAAAHAGVICSEPASGSSVSAQQQTATSERIIDLCVHDEQWGGRASAALAVRLRSREPLHIERGSRQHGSYWPTVSGDWRLERRRATGRPESTRKMLAPRAGGRRGCVSRRIVSAAAWSASQSSLTWSSI